MAPSCLPRASLTLNVFEPRYLALVDHALAGNRLIGMVQPAPEAGPPNRLPERAFPCGGWAARDGSLPSRRSDDGRVVISLAGVARFLVGAISTARSRSGCVRVDFAPYAEDFVGGYGEDDVDRPRLIATLRSYLIANNLNADWERINSASNERLVNTLSILSPYGPEEKQALLEAPDLRARAEALVALAEMELAATDDGSGTSLQ